MSSSQYNNGLMTQIRIVLMLLFHRIPDNFLLKVISQYLKELNNLIVVINI